ncbi:hypothetical protein QOZ80_8BG0669590 [Eleusine coracana subsp. coracana]|nr:hypothetical protein QOZ80_8BG0669590 [Eleusine coracana subsp. coracana]
MEARPTRRRGTGTGTGTSPGRNKVWVEPPGKSNHRHHQTPSPTPANRVAVVYYLCRNRHLEHPHFIEVPLASPEEGLYLRDVINRLNVLRGKGMAAMYSWSCKRSYKNGFVWHDLSDDDLVLPAQGNEYILKGSELLDRSPPPDRQPNGVGSPKVEETLKQPKQESPQSRGSQEGCSSSSSPSAVVKEVSCLPPTPRPQQQAQPAMLQSSSASTSLEDGQCRTPRSGSSGNQSPEPAGRNAPLSEDGTADAEIQECHQQSSLVSPNGGPEIIQESPAMCSSDASPGNIGALGSSQHTDLGLLNGSLIETQKQDVPGRGAGTLKRSSSYDEDRVYRASQCKSDTESSVESSSFRCLPQSIKIISCKQSRNGTILSPASDVRNNSSRQEYSTRSSPLGSSKSASNRMIDPSVGKFSSSRMESFHEEKDVIKIEENFLLEPGL